MIAPRISRVSRTEFAVLRGCDYPCKQAAINYSANDGALNGPSVALPTFGEE